MLRNIKYSHGGKSFETDAVEMATGRTVTVQIFIFLAALNKENLYPYGFRYFDEEKGRKFHYTPEEFYTMFEIPADTREEIRLQRYSI